MRIQWCWRCKAEMAMLTDEESKQVWAAKDIAEARREDGRKAALAAYERITGLKESNFNAIFHHVLSQHGPPCPKCGKTLRTRVAYKCFECGVQLHEPNWTYMFRVEVEPFVIKGRGRVVVADHGAVVKRLLIGDVLEFRDADSRICRTTVLGIEEMHGPPSEQRKVGVLIEEMEATDKIRPGYDVWIVASPQREPVAQSKC